MDTPVSSPPGGEPSSGSPSIRVYPRRTGRVIGIAIYAALVYAAIVAVADFRSLFQQLSTFRYAMVGPVLVMVLMGYGSRAFRWHLYLHRLGSLVPLKTSLLTYISGFSMGVTPGRVGEIVKTYHLSALAGTPYRISLAALLAERATDLVSVVVLLTIGLSAWPSIGPFWGVVGIVGILLLISFVREPRGAKILFGLMGRLPGVRRLLPPFDLVHQGLAQLLLPLWVFLGSGLSLLTWGLETTALWALAQGLGLALTWNQCAFAFAVGSLAGILSLLPGGLGAKEGGIIAILLAFGVPLDSAASLTILARLATFWFGWLLGALTTLGLRLKLRRKPATPVAAREADERFEVLGAHISAITIEDALEHCRLAIRHQLRQHVCVCSVDMVMQARENPRLRQAVETAGLVTPDGWPLTRMGRRYARRKVGRVRGTDLFLRLSALAEREEYSFYLLGSTPEVLGLLEMRLLSRFPRLRILGRHAPARREAGEPEEPAVLDEINRLGPDVVWVGLGCPKQEIWMLNHRARLAAPLLIGIGAAFDFVAGTKPQAPRWVQNIGLEWLWRFFHEPRRLWRRVVVEGPKFFALVARESIRRTYRSPGEQPKQQV